MADLNRNLPQVDPSHFAMVPRSDVPRSTFKTEHTHKTTFDMGYLVPIHIDEVLPGDVHQGNVIIFARVNNLLFPLMDNLEVETFFFFVPARILWANFQKFMGAQDNPTDSIAYTMPQLTSPSAGYPPNTVFDYFGLPCVGQIVSGAPSANALPLRAYNKIWNQWFRDENLDASVADTDGDGPDGSSSYTLLRRRKRHDYFTSALPWPLKGGVDISLPVGGTAAVKTSGLATITGAQAPLAFLDTAAGAPIGKANIFTDASSMGSYITTVSTPTGQLYPSNLYADLSTATGNTINAIRLAVTTQQFLEKNARGGTRYTELLRMHFGVTPEDARLQRPEYIGGGRSAIHTSAIPQTSATGLTGGSTYMGSLTAQAVVADRHRFSYHATEHGYIIGLVHVGADLTYQQGLHRMWTRQTRYDFYWPTFANLGEQAVRNDEIYVQGTGGGAGVDAATFGYQERWAEYRYRPSRISGLFRSTSAGTIDQWHAAQRFTALPTLAPTFIADTPPATRFLAAGSLANGMQILFDSVFSISCTRPVPTYSVPGLARF